MATPLQIVGYKNSGKTTLIESFIPLLKKEMYTVAVIKHDGHDFEIDTPNTDSYQFAACGAEAVMITSLEKFALIAQKRLSLQEALKMMPDTDVLLIEGYKEADFPKIVLVHNQNEYDKFSKQLTNIIAFASYKIRNNPNIAPIENEQKRIHFAQQTLHQFFYQK